MIAYMFQKYPENSAFQLFKILWLLTREIFHFLCYVLKKVAYFLTVSTVFSVSKQNF